MRKRKDQQRESKRRRFNGQGRARRSSARSLRCCYSGSRCMRRRKRVNGRAFVLSFSVGVILDAAMYAMLCMGVFISRGLVTGPFGEIAMAG